MKYEKQKEIYEFVIKFQKEFSERYGAFPFVQYKLVETTQDKTTHTDLHYLEECSNKVFVRHLSIVEFPDLIRTKARQRALTVLRQCMFLIGSEMGYGSSVLGKYFNFNHATVIYAQSNIKNLLSIKDEEVLKIYTELQDEIKKQPGIDGTVQFNNETEPNT